MIKLNEKKFNEESVRLTNSIKRYIAVLDSPSPFIEPKNFDLRIGLVNWVSLKTIDLGPRKIKIPGPDAI